MNKHSLLHNLRKHHRSLCAISLRIIEASIALGTLWVTPFTGGASSIGAFVAVIDAAIFTFWLGIDAASLHDRFRDMWLLRNQATYALSGSIRSESIRDFAAVLEMARRKAQSVPQLSQSMTPEQVLRHIPVHELANIWLSRTGEIEVIRRRTRIAQPELVPAVLALFVEPGTYYSVTYRGVRRTWLIHSPEDIREQIENVHWRQISVGLRFDRRRWSLRWFVDQAGPYTVQTICTLLCFDVRWMYPVVSLETLLEARARYEHAWDEEDRASLALRRLQVTFTRNPVDCPLRPVFHKYMLQRGNVLCLLIEYRWRSISITKMYQ